MDDIETTATFFKHIENKNWYAVSHLLDDDFQYFGPTPDPYDKEIWLSFQEAILEAFPDWAYNLSRIEKVNDAIEITVKITGTHLQELALPWHDFKSIPATGIKIALPEERALLKFKDGKIRELRVPSTLHGGLFGLLEQLGVE